MQGKPNTTQNAVFHACSNSSVKDVGRRASTFESARIEQRVHRLALVLYNRKFSSFNDSDSHQLEKGDETFLKKETRHSKNRESEKAPSQTLSAVLPHQTDFSAEGYCGLLGFVLYEAFTHKEPMKVHPTLQPVYNPFQ